MELMTVPLMKEKKSSHLSKQRGCILILSHLEWNLAALIGTKLTWFLRTSLYNRINMWSKVSTFLWLLGFSVSKTFKTLMFRKTLGECKFFRTEDFSTAFYCMTVVIIASYGKTGSMCYVYGQQEIHIPLHFSSYPIVSETTTTCHDFLSFSYSFCMKNSQSINFPLSRHHLFCIIYTTRLSMVLIFKVL